MRETTNNSETAVNRNGGLMQNPRVRRIAIYAGILLAVFLLGLVPMWLTARERAKELSAVQATLRVSHLQNALANAVLDARRGEYEPARQTASVFFTNLREEVERGNDSVFTPAQQESARALLANRDDAITMLARSDPASLERLAELHAKFRGIVGDAPAQPANR